MQQTSYSIRTFWGYPKYPIPHDLWRNPRLFLAFGLGTGAFPRIPGTMGTLLALIIYCLFPAMPWLVYCAGLLILTGFAIYLAGYAEKLTGIEDHPGIVCDEMVGFWLTTLMLPAGLVWLISAFVLFRLFDISKPWPIQWLQRNVPGGFGIVIDDLMAGLYAWLILQACVQIQRWF